MMQFLLAYAMSFTGVPYKWGGSNPIDGMDCSGFVQEVLKAGGLDPSGDQTAQGLYDYFSKNGSQNKYGAGALAFFGESVLKITHVAFCVDETHCLEAGGGNHLILTKQDAAAQNAFIRLRPLKYRKDLQAVIMPYYPGRI